MKLSLRTLRTDFEIEIDPDDKLINLKKKIEDVLGPEHFDVAHQLLICKMKIIQGSSDNDRTLRELNVDEEGLVSVSALPKKPLVPAWELPIYKEKVIAIARAQKKKEARKANSNYVAKATLSMCKDPRYGVKVYSRKKNLGKLC